MKLFLAFSLFSAALFSTTRVSAEQILRDLPYLEGAKNDQSLDLYLPASVRPAPPLLVFVHGGAWISGDKGIGTTYCQAWTLLGIACATINYRLATTSENRHPAQAEDLASAVAWLAKAATKYGYNPKKIFVAGHSAGAHMAASLATTPALLAKTPKEFQPAGYVGVSGIYDIPLILARYPNYRDWFVGRTFGFEKKGWEAGSPTRNPLATKRPWLIVHSHADELVEDAQAIEFQKHLQAAGVKVEMERPQSESHFEALLILKPIEKFIRAN